MHEVGITHYGDELNSLFTVPTEIPDDDDISFLKSRTCVRIAFVANPAPLVPPAAARGWRGSRSGAKKNDLDFASKPLKKLDSRKGIWRVM